MIIHLYKDGLEYAFECILTDDYPNEVNTFCDRTTKRSAWGLFIKYLNFSSILIEKKRKAERLANEKAVETLSRSMSTMYGVNPQTRDGSWEHEVS